MAIPQQKKTSNCMEKVKFDGGHPVQGMELFFQLVQDHCAQFLLNVIPPFPRVHHRPPFRFAFHHLLVPPSYPLVELQGICIQAVPFLALGLPANSNFNVYI